MASLQAELQAFRARRAQTGEALSGIDDQQITTNVDGQGDVRWLLWRVVTQLVELRVELARTIEGLGWRQTDAQRILGCLSACRTMP